MRTSMTVGVILIVVAILMLSIHSLTYFLTEHEVGPLGFFAWDVARPHTLFVNPIAGLVALAVGVALVVAGRRSSVV
jgi:hypothetical protein